MSMVLAAAVMPLSVSDFVLRARRMDLQAMEHLATRVTLAAAVGRLVDALQWERGVTSLWLASEGQVFAAERAQAVAQAGVAEQVLRAEFGAQLQPDSGASAPMMSMMGWVLLDLGNLVALRAALGPGAPRPRASDAVAGFSRVIAGLIELVFHLADDATDPAISRLLVALVHLFQVKEAAGQERALGAHLLASGLCTEGEQQRFIHLIDAQERAATVLLDFIDPDLRPRWSQADHSANMAQLERLRRGLCMARTGARLDETQSRVWFEVSSHRIAELGGLEAALVDRLQAACRTGIDRARQDLADSTGLVEHLRENPSPHAQAVGRYFSDQGHPEAVPVLAVRAEPGAASAEARPATDVPAVVASLQEVLQRQATRLAQTEQALQRARQALNERKVIERAKGMLMQRMGMTEDMAYRALQKAAMDNNKRLLEVAEATLALSDIALAPSPTPAPAAAAR